MNSHRARWMARALGVVTVSFGALVAVSGSATAAAEFDSSVEQAVVAARQVSGCPPLRYDPRVERAALVVNRSTREYLDHTAQHVPADQPEPVAVVSDAGVTAAKVRSLQGAGAELVDAVQGLVLQGYRTIPDCQYTDFGVDHLVDSYTGKHLVVVLLVVQAAP